MKKHTLALYSIIMVFIIPQMTVGHMLFAVIMTMYILMRLHVEEKALTRQIEDVYRHYQQMTPQLQPGVSPKRPSPQCKVVIRTVRGII